MSSDVRHPSDVVFDSFGGYSTQYSGTYHEQITIHDGKAIVEDPPCPPNLAARNARAEARIQNHHMAVVNAQSISDDELQASKFKNYKMGGLEQYHLTHLSDNQRLVYFPNMESSEILVFKQGAYDVSDTNIVTPLAEPHKHHILHTAFLDPTAPRGTVPRKAIACPGVLVVLKTAEPKSDDKGDAKNQRVQKGDARSTLLHRTGLAPSWKKELKQTFPPEE